jgi:hypothetical protein
MKSKLFGGREGKRNLPKQLRQRELFQELPHGVITMNSYREKRGK